MKLLNFFGPAAALAISPFFSSPALLAEDNFANSPRSNWDFYIELMPDDITTKTNRKGDAIEFKATGFSFIISHHGPESDDWVRDWGNYSIAVKGSTGKNPAFSDCYIKAKYAKKHRYNLQVFAYKFKEFQLHVPDRKRYKAAKAADEAELGRKLTRDERVDLWRSIRVIEVLRDEIKIKARRNKIECAVFYWNPDWTSTFVDDQEIYDEMSE